MKRSLALLLERGPLANLLNRYRRLVEPSLPGSALEEISGRERH